MIRRMFVLGAWSLGLSALLTVLSAWFFACLPPPVGTWPLEATTWPGPVPEAWNNLRREGDPFDYTGEQRALGRWDAQFRASATLSAEEMSPRPASAFELYSFDRRTFGWPWPALACDRLQEVHHSSVGPGGGPDVSRAVEIDDTLLVRGVRFSIVDRFAGVQVRLPLRMLWPGFLGNMACIWLAFALPVLVWRGWGLRRAAGRERAGLCAACGYELAGAPRCPECGVAARGHG